MPGRMVPLISGEIYHVFNRGSDQRDLFLHPKDYLRFVRTLFYYQFSNPKIKLSLFNKNHINTLPQIYDSTLIDMLCYCLMPNHFHLLIKQTQNSGISTFLSQLTNSYTKYFNAKYKRSGPLFQGTFKAVRIETNEQLIHVSRYIHINPVVARIVRNLEDYKWSSYQEYKAHEFLCKTAGILKFFHSRNSYLEFLNNHAEYELALKLLKHTLK